MESSTNQEGPTLKTDPAESKPSRYGIELEQARRLLGLPLVPDAAASISCRRRDDSNYDELEEGWKLTDQMVSAMGKCDWLKRELQDESLRQLVALVTAASNAVVKATIVFVVRGRSLGMRCVTGFGAMVAALLAVALVMLA